MHKLNIRTDDAVKLKLDSYPVHVRKRMVHLRSLILDVAASIDGLDELHECLKWGEPSYQTKTGSPIRMDWKERSPDQYALYFNCNTSLVSTFRTLYGEGLHYEKNRAIVLDLNAEPDETKLRHCIAMALEYKRLRHKMLLGN